MWLTNSSVEWGQTPGLTGHHPRATRDVGSVPREKKGGSGKWAGQNPRTQQCTEGSEMFRSKSASQAGFVKHTCSWSASLSRRDALEVLRDTLRCYYRPCTMSPESQGLVSLRRSAPLLQTSVRTSVLVDHTWLAPGPLPNLQPLGVAARRRKPE